MRREIGHPCVNAHPAGVSTVDGIAHNARLPIYPEDPVSGASEKLGMPSASHRQIERPASPRR
jgi:hypothetical protein